MHLGIDAVNIRQGGGLTHLSQLLEFADPLAHGFDLVTVWSGKATADILPERPWLIKRTAPWMDAMLPRRILGQQFQLTSEFIENKCDVLFSPGGTLPNGFHLPMVTMSQNMLPYEPSESARFGGYSLMRMKMHVLHFLMNRSFRRADGLIFLTRYAEKTVSAVLRDLSCSTALIAHGVEPRFFLEPRLQSCFEDYTDSRPFRLLYVSILMPYKHQMEVAKAVASLRAKGMPIEIYFVGGAWAWYGAKFKSLIEKLDSSGEYLKWLGYQSFTNLHQQYLDADAFVFASSCENLPNILIEAMAAGLPIACSNKGPMPEVLGDGGVYFDPEKPVEIANVLSNLIKSHHLRSELALINYHSAKQYSWERCAAETFNFLASIGKKRETKTI